MGRGRHIIDVEETTPKYLIEVTLLRDIEKPFAIMARTLSKSSFVVKLYHLSIQKLIHYLLPFIIVTMNVVNALATISAFARCKDSRHLGNPTIPSKC